MLTLGKRVGDRNEPFRADDIVTGHWLRVVRHNNSAKAVTS